MSKPNLLYYFRNKEDIHTTLMRRLLDTWLAPLRELDDIGDPMTELRSYIRRKLEMARDFPRESRLFANEVLQGAPRIMPMLEGELKTLVDEKAEVIRGWMRSGRIVRTDPYHLIFSIWATTQHYADFDVQVRAVLGPDRGGEGRFDDAARFLEQLFLEGLRPALTSRRQTSFQSRSRIRSVGDCTRAAKRASSRRRTTREEFMAKLLALYRTPKDRAAFDSYYHATHIPIAKKVPGLRKYDISQGIVATPGRPVRLPSRGDASI